MVGTVTYADQRPSKEESSKPKTIMQLSQKGMTMVDVSLLSCCEVTVLLCWKIDVSVWMKVSMCIRIYRLFLVSLSLSLNLTVNYLFQGRSVLLWCCLLQEEPKHFGFFLEVWLASITCVIDGREMHTITRTHTHIHWCRSIRRTHTVNCLMDRLDISHVRATKILTLRVLSTRATSYSLWLE